MSADNCAENVTVPLRNLLNSIQCIRDRVRGKYDMLAEPLTTKTHARARQAS